MRRSLLAAVLLAVVAAPAMAQETGTPVFLGPDRLFQKSGFGVSVSDPGDGIALEGSYRIASGTTTDFGFRVGFADPGGSSSTAFLLGGDYRARLLNHTEDFPLDGALVVGAGVSLVEGNNVLFVPVGFSLGRKILLDNSTTSFVPYFTPTVIPTFSDNSDLNFAVGLGVDIQFGSQFDLNVSGSFGDIDGVSVGFSWLH
jgi:opacity protein-like surface antigen